ncbi:hypothetical protein HYQ45_002412 [Verticillium longisporum]|uniref:Uncharacterized protein n=1 Tax=Verticillium longisporum TaxID=100787 RepID=A0A8I3AWA4_VERLO|nr:Putative hydrolase nit2 [Verticillium dahliae VDG1]KAG7140903.1 hypothetical protein HYQ45_002412 [Verticillium longisporum]
MYLYDASSTSTADVSVRPLGRKALEEAIAIRQPGYIVHCQEANALELALFHLYVDPYDHPLDGEDATKPVRGRPDLPANPKLVDLLVDALNGDSPIRPRLQGARYPGRAPAGRSSSHISKNTEVTAASVVSEKESAAAKKEAAAAKKKEAEERKARGWETYRLAKLERQ